MLGQERIQTRQEEGSTSGVSTINSLKSHKTNDLIENKYLKEYRDEMGVLKNDNMKLFQELLDCHKCYQTILQQSLEEQRVQMNSLLRICDSINRRGTGQVLE